VWTRRGGDKDLAHLVEVCRQHQVQRVVVGVPNRLDGTRGDAAERVLAFVERLRAALPDRPVDTRDEALTTWEAAERLKAQGVSAKKQRAMIDAHAAAVILQEDLDARR
jgi:putative Holliday junction resolvase